MLKKVVSASSAIAASIPVTNSGMTSSGRQAIRSTAAAATAADTARSMSMTGCPGGQAEETAS
jgi:hypothetical protein